jgi:hypothetical protein
MISDIASIACDPPLGSVTVVDDASVLFNVAINTGAIEGDVDVRLWHEVAEGWTDLPLSHVRRCLTRHGYCFQLTAAVDIHTSSQGC